MSFSLISLKKKIQTYSRHMRESSAVCPLSDLVHNRIYVLLLGSINTV